jgi:hypothetical protein
MSNILDKPTNKFYSTVFNKDTALGKWNRALDPLTTKVADDAVEKTTPLDLSTAVPPAPPVMPTSDDEAVKRARRRRIAVAQQQGGRASTIFTGSGEAKLGG